MIHFSSVPGCSNLTQLNTQCSLPAPRQSVFNFFADAGNLETITPEWLHFRVETELPIKMEGGALIDYRLQLHWIPIRWRTEISLYEPPFRFVDRQIRGPYRVWEHTHTFEEKGNGTLVCDSVNFSSPGGPLIKKLLVIPDLQRIFEYRLAHLAEIFEMNSAHGYRDAD